MNVTTNDTIRPKPLLILSITMLDESHDKPVLIAPMDKQMKEQRVTGQIFSMLHASNYMQMISCDN